MVTRAMFVEITSVNSTPDVLSPVNLGSEGHQFSPSWQPKIGRPQIIVVSSMSCLATIIDNNKEKRGKISVLD